MALQLVRDTQELTAYEQLKLLVDHYGLLMLSYDQHMEHGFALYDNDRNVFFVNRDWLMNEVERDEHRADAEWLETIGIDPA